MVLQGLNIGQGLSLCLPPMILRVKGRLIFRRCTAGTPIPFSVRVTVFPFPSVFLVMLVSESYDLNPPFTFCRDPRHRESCRHGGRSSPTVRCPRNDRNVFRTLPARSQTVYRPRSRRVQWKETTLTDLRRTVEGEKQVPWNIYEGFIDTLCHSHLDR